jgi:cytoskeleton-associated protein 5
VAINCFEAVLDACVNFGARHMPLPKFLDVAPKIMTHADGRIRDLGISILAEICRSFNSREIASDVIASLKPSQSNQLDAMLESKPNPSKPKCPTPCWATSESELSSPPPTAEQVIEELNKRKASADKAALLSRPPVDLLAALSKTEYKAKIAHPKWSEKVAALNILLASAGPAPHKLAKAEYKELVVELKKLIGHSHFSVVNHALKVRPMG